MNLAWNCRVCVWVAFSVCCAHACQATLEWIDQQHLAKTKMGYIFTLKFECHNSYNKLLLFNSESGDITWCNVNKYRIGFLRFFLITKTFLFWKSPKNGLKNKKPRRVVILLKFLSQLWLSFNLVVIFLWSHDLEKVTSLSVWLGVRPWY